MKYTLVFLGTLGVLLAFSSVASAHEHQVFMIGGKSYQFVVGSLNEPMVVDDKSGVELLVTTIPMSGQAHTENEGAPVTGLEQTLKVEVSAGEKKRTFDLKPAFGDPGAYQAVFFPTVQTTMTYRFFGTIGGVAVDLPFTCLPTGEKAVEQTTPTKISDTVTRVSKAGGFGCALAKADLGFPEASASLYDLSQKGGGSGSAIGIGIVALLVAVVAWWRARK